MATVDPDPAVMHDDTRDADYTPEADEAPDADEAPAGRPRRPDTAGRLPWLALVFVLLAIGDVVWYLGNLHFAADASISDMVIAVLQIIPSVTAILLPAALLARHPDATSRARTLLLGTILYAVVQGMLILTEQLQGFFESATPPSDDLPFLVPLAAIYNGLVSLVAAFGLVYIAVGLSQARRYEDRPHSVTSLFVPVAAVFGTAVGVLAVSRLQLVDTPMSPTLVVYLGATVVLGVLRIAAWAYVAASAARGWEANEDPSGGWRLGALGAALIVAALVLVNLNGLLDIADQTLVTVYAYAIVLPYVLGHVILLAAFALGLPSLDDPDDEGHEPDESYDEGYEDGDDRFAGVAFDDDDLAR